MSYPTNDGLIQSFKTTYRIIQMQTDGLSHEDSVRQLPFRGNCLNWVVGHIVVGRNRVLKLLGEAPVWERTEVGRYETGSAPITDDDQALPFTRVLQDLATAQARIEAALAAKTEGDLAENVKTEQGAAPVGRLIAGLHWHETYHTGQLELLRQLTGMDDAIV